MMSPAAQDLLTTLQSLPDDVLKQRLSGLLSEIQALPRADQKELRQRTVELASRSDAGGFRSRAIRGIVLHATGVKTIDSPEERALQEQINAQLAQLNGNLEDYRQLTWRPADQLSQARPERPA